MASPRAHARRLTASLPVWVSATVEHNETLRFEALGLVEQAKTRLDEIKAKPPADSASIGVAVLHPCHLAIKGLLAAKGFKAGSTKAQLALLPALYPPDALPEDRIADYVAIQGLKLQGQKSIDAAGQLIATAESLLAKGV